MAQPSAAGPVAPHGTAIPAGLSGLSQVEARRRLKLFGPNRSGAPPSARFKEWLLMLADPMASMLAIGGAVYLALGERREGIVSSCWRSSPCSASTCLWSCARGGRSKASPWPSRPKPPWCATMRNKQSQPRIWCRVTCWQSVRATYLYHADAIVRWAANLAVDESHLSGEAQPQSKAPAVAGADQLLAGSRVITGHGYAEVTATGARTRYGNIARLAQAAASGATPLQQKIGRMTARFLAAALIAAAIIFAIRLARGDPLDQTFLYAISLAMSAIPEEFLLVFTLFLSVSAWRLSRSRVLVRRFTSVETFGSTTVICLDKTGTLTRGTFSLEDLPHQVLDPQTTEHDLLEAAVMACESHPADPMEQAILIRLPATRPRSCAPTSAMEPGLRLSIRSRGQAHVPRVAP